MEVVKVRKANKVLDVPVSRLGYYLSEGFDQVDSKGNIVKSATGGKTVPVAEFGKVVAKLDEAKAHIAELESKVADLEQENTTLRQLLEEQESSEGEADETKKSKKKK